MNVRFQFTVSDLALKITEGSVIPRGYGIAWWNYHEATAVVMPIPFNIVAALGRRFYHYLRSGVRPSILDEAERRGYEQGARATEVRMFNRMVEAIKVVDESRRPIIEATIRETVGVILRGLSESGREHDQS